MTQQEADARREEFFEKYALWAMEQQQKYGIPASVTLAQAAVESADGTSVLARQGNNFFGIKSFRGDAFYESHYMLRNDDKPNEKFRVYESVADSFTDHSKVLMSRRYSACWQYASDDHLNWIKGIKNAGYATAPNYVSAIEGVISKYGLEKYDQQAIATATHPIGYMRGSTVVVKPAELDEAPAMTSSVVPGNYSFPLAGKDLVVSSLFGHRNAPTAGASTDHGGIDLRANYEDVLATEDGGKVVGVGSDSKSGKYVIVSYDRPDGSQWKVSYCHLSEQGVTVGNTVTAGMKIGVSGNTGVGTGPHLHLTVRHKDAGSDDFKKVDPLGYLAEIAVAGHLEGKVSKKGTGEDLLAERKENIQIEDAARRQADVVKDDENLLANMSNSSDPKDWLSLLMANGGINEMGQGGGFHDLISALFMGVIALAMQLDRGETIEPANDQRQVQALTNSQADQQTVIERRRNGADVAALRQNASLNFDIDYPEEQQANNVRLA